MYYILVLEGGWVVLMCTPVVQKVVTPLSIFYAKRIFNKFYDLIVILSIFIRIFTFYFKLIHFHSLHYLFYC